jgi:hypothetical protein
MCRAVFPHPVLGLCSVPVFVARHPSASDKQPHSDFDVSFLFFPDTSFAGVGRADRLRRACKESVCLIFIDSLRVQRLTEQLQRWVAHLCHFGSIKNPLAFPAD